MNAIVTNHHHFSRGVKLIIENGYPKWYDDAKKQRGKYGTDAARNPKFDGLLEPSKNIDDFVTLINLIYEFTGCEPDTYFKIDSKEKINNQDIIYYIYRCPLEQKINFVSIKHCGCNMGHCDAVIKYHISNKKYETYGDLVKYFSHDNELTDNNGSKYYEYPDSVWFSVEKIDALPDKIHQDYCRGNVIKVEEKLNPEKVYLSWSFGR